MNEAQRESSAWPPCAVAVAEKLAVVRVVDHNRVVTMLGRALDSEAGRGRRGELRRVRVGVVLQVELLLGRGDVEQRPLRLGAVGPQHVLPVARDRDRGQDGDDHDHDHELDQRKASGLVPHLNRSVMRGPAPGAGPLSLSCRHAAASRCEPAGSRAPCRSFPGPPGKAAAVLADSGCSDRSPASGR